jgi:Secretion system C-terminal sorting domain
MKIIHVFWIGMSLFGHVQPALSQCENGTNTNPAAPAPVNAGFKTNTFDWRQPQIPVTDKHGISPSTLTNPFFSLDDYLIPLQGGWDSYSKPEEGWELIKQDFGYAYLNQTWNGRSILSSTNSSKQTIAYMMLYNRYTTTLRIIPNLDLSQTANNSQVVVTLSMIERDRNYANYADLNFSALFNQYNPIQTALDQKTKVTAVTAPAQVQSSRLGFTFVDFKLSYDPCSCFFESAFKVAFTTKSTSTLVLQGRVLGNSTDIADKNAHPGNDFLTSVFNRDIPNQPYNQTFYSEAFLKKRMAEAAGKSEEDSGAILAWIKNAGKFVKAGKDLKGLGVSGMKFVSALGKLVPYFEFASILIDMSKSESKIQNPTVIMADLVAKGTITTNTILNGQEIIMGVPGSKNTSLLPEYPSSSTSGTKPMYPMYNEIPGHFAVLRTPTIHFNYEIVDHELDLNQKVQFIAKLPDNLDLSYALGSLVNVEKTQIFVGMEINDMSNGGSVKYVSPFLPLNQCKNLYAIAQFPLTSDHKTELGSKIPFPSTDVKLVFQIFYDFKPDASGNTKAGYDLIKVKANVVRNEERRYWNDPRYWVYLNAPTNLSIGETNVANGNTIFSFGDIHITGNITNTGSTPLIIIAQGDVNIDPNVQLTGNIEIRSNQLFPPGITPVIAPNPPMTADAIQTFCQKSEYKAKEGLPTVREPESEVSQTVSNRLNSAFVVSPNPFQDELRVRLELSETDFVKLWLANGLGQVVQMGLEETREKGVYEETLRTNDLAPGVYYLTLQTKRGVETKKIVKQL